MGTLGPKYLIYGYLDSLGDQPKSSNFWNSNQEGPSTPHVRLLAPETNAVNRFWNETPWVLGSWGPLAKEDFDESMMCVSNMLKDVVGLTCLHNFLYARRF